MNESEFLRAIEAEPANPVPRLVYADWLDEQGDPRGELLRIQEELRRIEVSHRAKKERRMHELLSEGVEPLLIIHVGTLGMAEVLIFPGEFLMGALQDSGPVEVRLKSTYWLGRIPVTQAEWQRVMGTEPWKGQEFVLDDPACPATFVSWEDAIAYCQKLSELEREAQRLPQGWEYQLPTEAQWEYACRAGTTTRYSFGDQEADLANYAWFDKNASHIGQEYAHAVGQKQPNPWGLYEMHGNICEWCRDWYQDKLPGGTDPVVTEGRHQVIRGGCWEMDSTGCLSAIRGKSLLPENRNDGLGFRVARVMSQ